MYYTNEMYLPDVNGTHQANYTRGICFADRSLFPPQFSSSTIQFASVTTEIQFERQQIKHDWKWKYCGTKAVITGD